VRRPRAPGYTRGMRPLAVLAVAAALPLAAQETATPREIASREIAWQSDFAAARAQAAKEHKPLCVLFRCER